MTTTIAPLDLLTIHLELLSQSLDIDLPANEVRCVPGRRYRWDFAWRDLKVAVEFDGGTWQQLPSHSSPAHQDRDREKLILGQLAGWIVVPVTASMVRSGRAIELVEQALRQRLGVQA